jgi:uncharacterized protein YbaP (TraB family)
MKACIDQNWDKATIKNVDDLENFIRFHSKLPRDDNIDLLRQTIEYVN